MLLLETLGAKHPAEFGRVTISPACTGSTHYMRDAGCPALLCTMPSLSEADSYSSDVCVQPRPPASVTCQP